MEEHPRRHADVVVGLDDEVRPGRDAVAHEGRDLAGFRRVRVPAEHGYDVARPLRLRDDRVRRPHGVRRRLPTLQFHEVVALQLRVVDPGHRQADVEPRRNSRGLVEAAAAPANRGAPLRAHLRRRALVGDVDRRGPRAAQGPQGGEARLRTDGLLLLCESSPNGLGLVPPQGDAPEQPEPEERHATQKTGRFHVADRRVSTTSPRSGAGRGSARLWQIVARTRAATSLSLRPSRKSAWEKNVRPVNTHTGHVRRRAPPRRAPRRPGRGLPDASRCRRVRRPRNSCRSVAESRSESESWAGSRRGRANERGDVRAGDLRPERTGRPAEAVGALPRAVAPRGSTRVAETPSYERLRGP